MGIVNRNDVVSQYHKQVDTIPASIEHPEVPTPPYSSVFVLGVPSAMEMADFDWLIELKSI
jgi:hypothetical protein